MSAFQVRKMRPETLPKVTELDAVWRSYPPHYPAGGHQIDMSEANLKCMPQNLTGEKDYCPLTFRKAKIWKVLF